MKCLYCRTENAFAEFHRHPSPSSAAAAVAKFSQIMRLPQLERPEWTRIFKAIHACSRHGNEVGLDAFGHWLVGEYECIRNAAQES